MPITPRNDANFKENLIDIIKLSYSANINKPFISGDKLLMGYSFSLKDDLDAICTQIYGANKAKVIEAIRKTITDTTSKIVVSKIDTEKLFNDINDAARAAYTKASGGAGSESLPEFKFSQDEQLNAILESKLKPLAADIQDKLRGSSLANLEEVKLTSSGTSQISKEHVALLALLHISSKKNIDPALAKYIKSKSRFKAWFWLAHESFSGDNPNNLKLLRQKISAQFGLYESDENNRALSDSSSAASMERVSFGECIDIFTHLNISKAMYVTKDKNGKEHKEDVTHLEFMQKDEERSNNTASKCEGLFKPFADKLNSLLSSETSKKFETENIYCVNLTSSSTSNASRINKLLKRREEELYKQEDMLILCPIKTATPIRIFQPKKSNFTIVLASQSEFDCSELNPKELNPSRPNYGKLNLCELILTDFKFDTYEKENNGASSDRDIKFKNAKTKSDSVILYKENDDGKDDKNKTKGACFTSIRQSSDEIEYKLEDGVVKMSHFKLPSSKDEYLNFNLLNFAKENNFTLRDDKDSAMFDMKLRLALGNNVVPTSTSSSSLALTLDNLIIENEKGEASDIDKIYLHHCGDKSIYESSSLVKNKESDMKNSYTATFNIPIDRNDKKDTKLIVYSSDLSKIYDTKGIHAYTGTAIISIGYKDKSGGSFSYTNKVSLRDITDHIVNVVSDNEYPFKTNEEISLKAIYKQEKGSKRYKEVLWGYMVIKSIEYNEVSKEKPREVVELKDKKGKEIRFKISDVIKKDDLDKLKQGGHTIVFFAYLEGEKDKFKYKSVYGKNHIRIDIKIPLYIKFKDDKLIIYEFEHAIKEKSFKASLNHDDTLVNKSGYLYINKDISAQDINIYEDDKLTKELKSEEKTNKRYQIYIDEANSANNQNPSNTNQTGQTKINQDTKYGINLLSKDNMNSFINSFNESKSITRVDKGMWVDGDREALVKIEIGNEIVFPLKIKPLNDKGMLYDWTLMIGDDGESQAIFGKSRNDGTRKHAARDLYTDMPPRTNANELAFTSNVEIVSIADGEVIQTGPFYYKTNHITIQYDTVEFGSFIIRYGEVDPSRVKVKVGDKVRKGQVIGYAGFMINNGKHPYIVEDEIVTMLHFEYFTNGANTKDAFTVKNDPNNKFKRRKDLADPLEILKEGYKNTFGETL
ncbi:M23 family metallopeptidase [Campylobacter concisus]|uniref:M23 family metallopeptidase n=1 Tax=Campylobacter concisus TaxID=199 RepID=UPI0021CC8173|nr:M23 family metallopeptidase [Campylobacter concisus]